MACGECKQSVEWVDRASVCAVMCDHCRVSAKNADGWAIGCKLTGLTVSAACRTHLHCPLSRLPDYEGIVVWLGIRWYGVPFPLRVWRWATKFNDIDLYEYLARYPQCGCIVVLKDWWEGRSRVAGVGGEFTVFDANGVR